jgi:hypothetical protein
MTPNEQELIDRLVTEVSSRKRLSGPLAKKFTDWMGSLDEYSLYSASHPSISVSDGYPYEFPWTAMKLSEIVERSLDAAITEESLDIDYGLDYFRNILDGIDEKYCRYVASLSSSQGDIAWILVTAGDRGQGGFEDEEYTLFATPLDIEQHLRREGFLFPRGRTPSGKLDIFTDAEIEEILTSTFNANVRTPITLMRFKHE